MSPAPQTPAAPAAGAGKPSADSDVPAGEGRHPGRAASELRRRMVICNQRGLHARAAAKFVRCAESFDADVRVQRQGVEVSGLSIMGLMMLAAAPGCCIQVTASGPQADAALAALDALVADKFGEGE